MTQAATADRSEPDGFVHLPAGGKLHYQQRGERGRDCPLLLLRPLGGDIETWGAFRERLQQRFHVIAFDHRGAGFSSPASLGGTTRSMARDAASLLAQLRIEQAYVFGESLGGMVAMWLAIDCPERVACLTLGSTAARGLVLARRGMAQSWELGRCMLRSGADAEICLSRQVLSDAGRGGQHAQAFEARARNSPSSRWELLKLSQAGARHDARQHLSRLRAPTLVLAGELDELVPVTLQQRLAEQLPNAQFDIVRSAAHAITVEQPERTADRVIRFIESASATQYRPGAAEPQ